MKQQSTIKTIYPKIKDRKTIAAIGMVRVDLTNFPVECRVAAMLNGVYTPELIGQYT